VVPIVGTAIGAVAGALLPHVLPKIPVVGDAVNKIPLIGGILSPKKKQAGGGHFVAPAAPNPHLKSGAEYAMGERSKYAAGRGYR
jgi:hypothetical protein